MVCLLMVILCVPAQIVEADHGWFRNFKDEKGVLCCGHYDCYPAATRVLSQSNPTHVVVEVDGVETVKHIESIHPSDSPGMGYVCLHTERRDSARKRIQCPSLPFDATTKLHPDCVRCVFVNYGG
jgi:hypothetical protein